MEEFKFDREFVSQEINDMDEEDLMELTSIIEELQESSKDVDPRKVKATIELFITNKKIEQVEDELVRQFRQQIQHYSETGEEI